MNKVIFKVLTLAVILAVTGTGRGEDAEAPAKEKILLKHEFVPGDYVQTIKTDMDLQIEAGERKMARKALIEFEIAMHLDKPDAAGDKRMTMAYKRIKMINETMGMKQSYDSSSTDPQDPMLEKTFGAMLKAKICMTIGADGKIRDVSGLDKLWDEIAKENPTMAQMAAAVKKSMGDAAIKKMVADPQANLPGKEVGAGDQWEWADSVEAPFLGAAAFEGKCTLKSIEQTPEGKTAVIGMVATVDTKQGQTAEMGPMKMAIRQCSIEMDGEIRSNVANPMLTTITMNQNGVIEMAMSAPSADQPAQAMKVNIKSKMVTTIKKAPPPQPQPQTQEPPKSEQPSAPEAAPQQ